MLYEDSECAVLDKGEEYEWFKVKTEKSISQLTGSRSIRGFNINVKHRSFLYALAQTHS